MGYVVLIKRPARRNACHAKRVIRYGEIPGLVCHGHPARVYTSINPYRPCSTVSVHATFTRYQICKGTGVTLYVARKQPAEADSYWCFQLA